MKTFTRVIAVLMMVMVLMSLLAACEEKNYINPALLGTWTDEDDGCTWTFNEDGTCHRYSPEENFDSDGTYWLEEEGNGRLHISLEAWDEEKICTYAVRPTVIMIEHMEFSFRGYKQ